MKAPLLRTPLFDHHVAAGARMVEFGGWSMPVQYTGILEEHKQVRTHCGLFDLSHMGEVWMSGPGAVADLQRLLTNDVGAAAVGQCVYSPMCNERGGVVDDLVAYRMAEDRYLLVVNASNQAKDLAWIRKHASGATEVVDKSADTALLALQGPSAADVLAPHVPGLAALASYHWRAVKLGGADVILSRTGYTGEDGFEVYCENGAAGALWDLFAKDNRVAPIGLGARDTLRLEARLLLYGNDLSDETTPLEAGLGWTVKFQKGDFTGRDALAAQKASGPAAKLVGLRMIGRGIPRHGYELFAGNERIGAVSSGTFSPTLAANIGLGYVSVAHTTPGSALSVRIRTQDVPAEVVKTPFYKRK